MLARTLFALVLVLAVASCSPRASAPTSRTLSIDRTTTEHCVDFCPLHGVLLRAGRARMSYGLLVSPEELARARREVFPASRSTVAGGCVIGSGAPAETTVDCCEVCRAAERHWYASHAVQLLERKHVPESEIPARFGEVVDSLDALGMSGPDARPEG